MRRWGSGLGGGSELFDAVSWAVSIIMNLVPWVSLGTFPRPLYYLQHTPNIRPR